MKNILALLGSRLLVPLISVVLTFVLARDLGPAGMGGYATIMAVLALAMSASTLGIRNIVIREVAAAPHSARAYVHNSSVLVLGFSLVTYAVLVAFASLAGYPAEVRSGLVIAGAALFAYAVSLVFEAAFLALGDNTTILKATLAQHVFRVAGSVAALFAGFGLNGVLVAFVMSNALLAAYYAFRAARAGFGGLGFDTAFIRERILGSLGAFTALDLIANAYAKLSVLVLSSLVAPEAVGLYAAALGLYQIIGLIQSNLALDLYRKVSASPGNESAEFHLYLRRTVALLAPVLVVTWCFAPQLITLLYGAEFRAAARLLRILVLGAAPFTLSVGLAHILLSSGRVRVELNAVCVNTVISLAITLLLVRAYGATGGAVAAAVGPLPLLALQATALRAEVPLAPLGRLLADCIPLVVWGIGTALLAAAGMPWVFAAALCCVVYAPFVLLSRVLPRSDRAVLRRLIPGALNRAAT